MKISGAIFDMDGTMLDSMHVWETLGEDYLKSIGVEPKPDVSAAVREMSLWQVADLFMRDYGMEGPPEKIVADIERVIENLYLNVLELKPGVKEFLLELKKRNIPMCVATATNRRLVEGALGRCGILELFDGVFTCGEVGAGKELPTIYEAARAFLKTPREETLVFEDMVYAARTAGKAGFKVVGIYDAPSADAAEELESLSDIFVRESMMELMPILDFE